jgi:hypothetical protein
MEVEFPNLDAVQKDWQADFQLLMEQQQEALVKTIATQLESAVHDRVSSGITIIGEDGKPRRAEGGIKIEMNPNKTSFSIIFYGDMETIEYGDAHNHPQSIIRPFLDQIVHQNNA